MRLASKARTRAAWVLLALVVAAGAVDAGFWWRRAHWNAVIEGRAPVPASGGLPAEVQFAVAAALTASAATAGTAANGTSAAGEDALHRWRSLQGDSPLGQAARFNSANLLMRQALLVRAGSQPGQAVPLIELAKEIYREVLRHDPGQWDARYNLERAQRLLPDPDAADIDPTEAPPAAERAATTMRGYSPGLP